MNLNPFFNFFIQDFIYQFVLYLVLCNGYKRKVSRKKAYVLAFLSSLYLPLVDALSAIYVGGRIIPYTFGVAIGLKVLMAIEEVFLLLFIIYVLEIVWYKCYWWSIILHFVLFIPDGILYADKFTRVDTIYNYYIIMPLTLRLLPVYLLSIFCTIALGGLLFLISRYIQKIDKINSLSKWTWYVIYTVWAFVVIGSNKSYFNSKYNGVLIHFDNFNSILLIIAVIIITLFASINLYDKHILRVENNLLKQQNKIQYTNYLMQQRQEMEIHKLYHDIGNHIETIQILVTNGEQQEAKEYTDNLVKKYRNIRKNYYCSNKIINAVFSQKLKLCDKWNISYDLDINIPKTLSINDIDLMSVTANLLDNAIEGCHRNTDSENYINIKLAIIGSYFTVKVINSKSDESGMLRERTNTWKKDKYLHGYGLKILDEIVRRYDGQKEFIDNGNEFSAMLMLKTEAES